jgi:hypothetical protein
MPRRVPARPRTRWLARICKRVCPRAALSVPLSTSRPLTLCTTPLLCPTPHPSARRALIVDAVGLRNARLRSAAQQLARAAKGSTQRALRAAEMDRRQAGALAPLSPEGWRYAWSPRSVTP